jgi:hypothetical protein
MRLLLVAAVAAAGIIAAIAAETNTPSPGCAVQLGREVSFRNATSKDFMDVAVGTGPCNAATLTIIIRDDVGHVLYIYAEQFEQHVIVTDEEPLHKQAAPFVEGLIKEGLVSTESLPAWLPPERYEQEHNGGVSVTREVYEKLRAHPRPMLSHPTYFEGWKSVVYDEKAHETIEVVSGGS